MRHRSKLIFVYNADSGLLNDIISVAHKTLSPKTYSCNLCRLTFGLYSMRKPWKEFIKALNVEVEFLHRDVMMQRYGMADIPLPAVLEQIDTDVSVWINADDMNQCRSLDDLIELIQQRLDG